MLPPCKRERGLRQSTDTYLLDSGRVARLHLTLMAYWPIGGYIATDRYDAEDICRGANKKKLSPS